MNAQTERYLIDGPSGKLEVAIDRVANDRVANDRPEDAGVAGEGAGRDAAPRYAFVAHPHPLFGGTMDNKVAQTLARAFVQMGYVTARLNFRGVGQSTGEHDNGDGEQDDLLALIDHVRGRVDPSAPASARPVFVLGGFSFGAFVTSRVAATLRERGDAAARLALVGTPAGRWEIPVVPEDTLVIHGEQDETIPLADVFTWARPQELPVNVLPGADHFFHRKLHVLKRMITESWRV
ncbi:MAG: alpha/beta hydrolase [Janthinobacterium lividum]